VPATTAENTLPLRVHDVGFLLDRLGEDCHPLQFLRELTQNAIEAILNTPEKSGKIVWDVDWLSLDLGEHTAFKLSITDTGCGMTGEEMRQYINQLSSSGSIQSTDGNYGVGAKVAAATRNHAGLIYLSWKDGRGAMIHLWRNPETRQYGLRQIERPDGTFGHWAELDDLVKPEIISDHGTKIILFGNSPGQDTMKAPPEAASPSTWIAKYINSRYFRIPEGIEIRARQGWEQPRSNADVNVLRTLVGQRAYLEQHKQSSGTVPLSGARAHWWILKDETALGSNSGFIESTGHIAALHRDELYELIGGRSGQARLQQFGVLFGYREVVIYVEPTPPEGARLTTNTARTELLLNSQRLPWAEWAADFRENLPSEIAAHMELIASRASETDHSKSIRERLKGMLALFKVSRYKPTKEGILQIAEPTPNAGGRLPRGDGGAGGNAGGGSKSSGGGAVGGIYSAFLKVDGQPGRALGQRQGWHPRAGRDRRQGREVPRGTARTQNQRGLSCLHRHGRPLGQGLLRRARADLWLARDRTRLRSQLVRTGPDRDDHRPPGAPWQQGMVDHPTARCMVRGRPLVGRHAAVSPVQFDQARARDQDRVAEKVKHGSHRL
jgi:hypothetical protein